jgi:hypothetical protein
MRNHNDLGLKVNAFKHIERFIFIFVWYTIESRPCIVFTRSTTDHETSLTYEIRTHSILVYSVLPIC